MGDCMIFLAVVMLGRRSGSIAAAIGGALSDLLAGAAAWVAPTLIIKFAMAFIMGTVIEKAPMAGRRQLAGAAAGGIFPDSGLHAGEDSDDRSRPCGTFHT